MISHHYIVVVYETTVSQLRLSETPSWLRGKEGASEARNDSTAVPDSVVVSVRQPLWFGEHVVSL